ncbi:hypothetical protein PCASD_05573 [Puccinia coronata f. sp. avenae]|uniref:OTU domain-containing protein n=1 Tax=Puccinia coronata f. sp. avenae TaxID=200324 RepID=A0A2N5UVS0_9BASI|nr:hypothetical protein PCASD_05573 [Puccinia coronata f. sp. avenae]
MEGEDSSDEDIPLDQLVPNRVQDTQDGPEAPGPMNVGTVAAQGSNNDDDEIEIFRAAPEPTPAQTWARVRANMGKYLSTKVFEIYLPGVPKIKHGLNPNLPFHEPTPEIPLRYSRFIQGDGHCLFRAIAYWRFGDQDRHQEVRQAVIDFAPKHEEELKRGMTERGYDRWCQRIKGGGWGDQACLDLLARYYQLIIFTAGFHFRPADLPPFNSGTLF